MADRTVIKSWNIGGDGNTAYTPATPNGTSAVVATLYSDGALEFTGSGNTVTFPANDPSALISPWSASDYINQIKTISFADGVLPTDLTFWFATCANLVSINKIPSSVTNMIGTFYNCTSLTSAPAIPSSAINIMGTFLICSALTGKVQINSNPTNYDECFTDASTNTGTSLVVDYDANCTNIDSIIATKSTNSNITKGGMKNLTIELFVKSMANNYRRFTSTTSKVKVSNLFAEMSNISVPILNNGMNWVKDVRNKLLTTIDYGNGKFVVGSKSDADAGIYEVYENTRKIGTYNISKITSVDLVKINRIKFANGKWVAATKDGIYYSTDGETWTAGSWKLELYNVDYFNGLWIATGPSNTTYNRSGIYYSVDGITWTAATTTKASIDYNFNGICLADTCILVYFINEPILYYSADGKAFEAVTNTNRINSISYSNGIFVMNTSAGIYYSTDGKAWTVSNIATGTSNKSYFADGIWLADCGGKIYYSTDGKTWTDSGAAIGNVECIYYINGLYIISDENAVYYSKDYIIWTKSLDACISGIAMSKSDGMLMGVSPDGLYRSNLLG